MNILIFGDNTRSTMILKKLIQVNSGHNIHIANFGAGPHATLYGTNYCTLPLDRSITLSHKILLEYCFANKIDEIIPVADEAVELIRLHLVDFYRYAHNFLPDDNDLIYRLKDKFLSPDLFEDLLVSGDRQLIAPQTCDPYFRKPRHSCIAADGILVSQKVMRHSNSVPKPMFDEEYSVRGGIFYHEKHIGHSQSVHGYVGIDGHLSYVTQRRIHEPGGGGGSRRAAVAPSDTDCKIANRVKELGWVGPFMLECRLLPSEQYGFVEFNPRFWGSLSTSIASGLELSPAYLNTGKIKQYVPGKVFANVEKDAKFTFKNHGIKGLLSLLICIRSGDFITDTTVVRKTTISEFLAFLIFRIKSNKIARKIKIVFASLSLFRYRLNFDLLGDFNKIIFVCRGNVHRSIFSELFCKKNKILAQKEIVSRSILRRPGRQSKVPEIVQKLYNLPIDGRSKPLQLLEITDETVIICFDFKNVVDLETLGVDKSKIFLLRQGIIRRTIKDPDKLATIDEQCKQFDKIAAALVQLDSHDTSSL